MTKKPVVAVPGEVHPFARNRLQSLFDIRQIDLRNADSLSAEDRAAVNGMATFMAPVDGELMTRFPALEIVASFGVGYDHVDARAAAKQGIMVTHTPSVLDDEVADTAIGLLLNTLRELPRAENWLRDGKWEAEGGYRLTPLTLRDRKVGIFGMGRIGKAIARRLEGFGVAIHYHNRTAVAGSDYVYHQTLEELADAVDTIINVVPATPETAGRVNGAVLRQLGPNGVFINVGRGATVDEEALADALHDGTIAAAGLDVFVDEPRVPERLLSAPNAVLLPHVASASVHTRQAMADLVVDNLERWFAGDGPVTPVPECLDLPRR